MKNLLILILFFISFTYADDCCSLQNKPYLSESSGDKVFISGDFSADTNNDSEYHALLDTINSELAPYQSGLNCSALEHNYNGDYTFTDDGSIRTFTLFYIKSLQNCDVCQEGFTEINNYCEPVCDSNLILVNHECVEANPFNCSAKGSNWGNSSVPTSADCEQLVIDSDGFLDAATFYDNSTSNTPTCCVHQAEDSNATDDNATGGGDVNGGTENNETVPPTHLCPDGKQWNPIEQTCDLCNIGERFDSVSRKCVDTCPVGTVWSNHDEMCVSDGTNSECPMGYVRSSESNEPDCTNKGVTLAQSYNSVNTIFIDNDSLCCIKFSSPNDSNDSNGSGTEGNNINGNPLHGTNGRLDQLGGKLDNLISSTERELGEVNEAIKQASRDNNKSLGDIKQAVNNASTANTNNLTSVRNAVTSNTKFLEDINKSLSAPEIADEDDDNSTTKSKLEKTLNNAWKIGQDALKSFNDTKTDFGNIINGNDAPVFNAPVGNCEISFDILNQHIVITMATFAVYKPYIQLVMNWVLLIYMLQFYSIVARDISKYFFS